MGSTGANRRNTNRNALREDVEAYTNNPLVAARWSTAYTEEVRQGAQEMGRSSSRPNGWNFPGIRDSVDRLEQQLNRTRSASGTSRILRALREQEVVINRALAENNPNNDRNALLTYRRRIRQLISRIRTQE